MTTILGLALGALFLIIPLCIANAYGVKASSKMLTVFIGMLLRVGIFGGAVYLLAQSGSVLLCVLFAIVVMVFSIVATIVKARLKTRTYLVPVATGMLVAIVLSSAILLFANISVGSDFCLRYLLPVVAILSGGMTEPVAKALSAYYMGLRHNNQLYYYLIGNGATRAEALRYLQKRALDQVFASCIKQAMAATFFSPILMWTMLMCGVQVFDAVCWQLLLVMGVFASSIVAVAVAVIVARRYVADGYAMLKDVQARVGENVTDYK